MTADDLRPAKSSAVIDYGCALSRLRFADRRYSWNLRRLQQRAAENHASDGEIYN